jgi:hypothetical protein
MARAGWLTGVLAIGFMSVGCVIHVAPPPAPQKVIPKLDIAPEPPGDGDGQVIIDTTNGPATVTVVLLGLGNSTALTKTICATTPCAANLPIGSHDLVFSGKGDPQLASTDAVQVNRAPSVIRHTVGRIEQSPGLLWGGMGAVTLGAIGMMVYGVSASSADILGESKTGDYIGLGVSAGITAAGVVMMMMGRTKLQPGSSVQWNPDGSIPVDKVSGRNVIHWLPNGVSW